MALGIVVDDAIVVEEHAPCGSSKTACRPRKPRLAAISPHGEERAVAFSLARGF